VEHAVYRTKAGSRLVTHRRHLCGVGDVGCGHEYVRAEGFAFAHTGDALRGKVLRAMVGDPGVPALARG
jgi:hypothetical protein